LSSIRKTNCTQLLCIRHTVTQTAPLYMYAYMCWRRWRHIKLLCQWWDHLRHHEWRTAKRQWTCDIVCRTKLINNRLW